MIKKKLSEIVISEHIDDMWQPHSEEQREYLMSNFTIQSYKKNEVID